MGVLVAKVSFSLAPEPGEDIPSHASLHTLPNPDPVSHHVHLFLLRSHGSAVVLIPCELGCASVPSGASCSARKVFAAAPGALVLACVIVRLSVAALGARMRSPAHSCVRPHPRTSPAGSSRKLRSRKFDVKFKSGLFPEFQVRLIRP